jgi:His-Xaa-Ser repeat protein HxsA
MRDALNIAGVMLATLQGASQSVGDASHDNTLGALASHDARFVVTLPMPLNTDVQNMYAGHRSHSSHASHSSHSSHYSGSGGSYASPATPATPATPSTSNLNDSSQQSSSANTTKPAQTTPNAQRPNADQLAMMIMRVQAALYSKGYDPGAIDGQLSEATKLALRKFQGARGLAVTGSMTTETLSALGVSIR